MKTSLVQFSGKEEYTFLFTDHTMETATKSLLEHFLIRFKSIDENPSFKQGTKGHWNEDDPDIRSAKTYAYITDNDQLILLDASPFEFLTEEHVKPIIYISTKEYAEKFGLSVQRVHQMVENNEIHGIIKIANRYVGIPDDAVDVFRQERKEGKK